MVGLICTYSGGIVIFTRENPYLSAYLLIFALELSDNYDTINTIVIVCSMRVGFGPLLIVVKVL